MVKSRVLRSELKTLSPPPPSLVSFFTSHSLILSSSFSSSHPQAIMLTRIVLSKGCGQAGTPILLVLPHDVNLICIPPLYTSSLAPPQPCLCWFHMTDSSGLACSSFLFHLAVFQAVETHFALSSRLLSYFSCCIRFLLWWRVWVPQCPSQSVMFRHKEVADRAHWAMTLTSLFWTCCSCAHLTRLCSLLLWSPEILLTYLYKTWDFPGGTSGKEPTCQCRRHKRYRFHPWVGKIPRRRAGQSTPVLLPGASPRTEEPSGL